MEGWKPASDAVELDKRKVRQENENEEMFWNAEVREASL